MSLEHDYEIAKAAPIHFAEAAAHFVGTDRVLKLLDVKEAARSVLRFRGQGSHVSRLMEQSLDILANALNAYEEDA